MYQVLGLPKSICRVEKCIKCLDIEVDGKLHRALDDAIHTAKIFIEVLAEETRSR